MMDEVEVQQGIEYWITQLTNDIFRGSSYPIARVGAKIFSKMLLAELKDAQGQGCFPWDKQYVRNIWKNFKEGDSI